MFRAKQISCHEYCKQIFGLRDVSFILKKSRCVDSVTQSISFQSHSTIRKPLVTQNNLHCISPNDITPNTGLTCARSRDVGDPPRTVLATPVAKLREPEKDKSYRRSRCSSGHSDYYTGEEDLSSSTTGSIVRDVMKER